MLAALSLELEQRQASRAQPANGEEPKIGMVRSRFGLCPTCTVYIWLPYKGSEYQLRLQREHIILSWYSIPYINRLYSAHKHMSDRERLHADAGFIFIFGDVLHAAGHRFDRIFSSPQASTCPSL